MLLALAWFPRRVRNAEAKGVGILGEQAFQECALPGARWSAEDEWAWSWGGHLAGQNGLGYTGTGADARAAERAVYNVQKAYHRVAFYL